MLTEKIINLLQNIREWLERKDGGYLLEAAITVPIFFSAMIVLISIIPMVSTCEEIVYSASDEIRYSCLKQNFVGYDLAVEKTISNRINACDKILNHFVIDKYYQGISKFGMKNVNIVEFNAEISMKQPFSFNSCIFFDGKMASRAFNGRKNYDIPTTETEFMRDENSEKVLIFPKGGVRYHRNGCRYTTSHCRQAYLTSKIKKKYDACKTCKSENMRNGESIFYFVKGGKVYHRGDCKTIEKYYIEVEKHDAEKKGYTPCTLCIGA